MKHPEDHSLPGDRADSLLTAMGKALRTDHQAPKADDPLDVDEDNTDLIQNITRRIADQQLSEAKPLARRHRHRAGWASGLGLAASLFLGVMVFGGHGTLSSLPAYTAEIAGVDREFRSATPEAAFSGTTARASLGNRLVITLRPELEVVDPVFASAWHLTDSGVRLLEVPLQAAPSGAVRLDAVIGQDLKLAQGRHRIWLVVARDPSTAAGLDLRERQSAQASDDYYILPLSLEVLGQ